MYGVRTISTNRYRAKHFTVTYLFGHWLLYIYASGGSKTRAVRTAVRIAAYYNACGLCVRPGGPANQMFKLVGFCGVIKHELLSLSMMFVMNLVISTDQLHYWELVKLYFMHAVF